MTLRAPKKLSGGRLRADGVLARAGVQIYPDPSRPDGIRRELRPDDEVFAARSLTSLEALPLVEDHPASMLGSKAPLFAKGWTQEGARRDGDFVVGSVLVTDADLVATVEGGKAALSVGYEVDLDETPGEHPIYGKYDAIQRNIRGDHLAVVDVGRAGPEARLRLDTAGRYDHIAHEGGKWVVYSYSGSKKLGEYDTEEEAKKRLAQIEHYKDSDWDTAYVNDLPDSAFLAVSSGGSKDGEGKTVPRSLRHFPYKNAQGAVDLSHLRNALSRIPQSDAPDKDALTAKARRILAEADGGRSDSAPRGLFMKTVEELQTLLDAAIADAAAQARRADAAEAKCKTETARADAAEGTAQGFEPLKTEVDALRKGAAEIEDLKAKNAKLEGERDAAVKARRDAEDPAKIQSAVRARVEMESKARRVMGAEFRCDGLSDRALQEAVLRKLGHAVESTLPDLHVAARFDAAVACHASGEAALARAREASSAVRAERDRYDRASARERMINRNRGLAREEQE